MRPIKETWVVGAVLAALGGATALWGWKRLNPPSSLSHLKVGRLWEYTILAGEEIEQVEVLESFQLPDGREAFRVEYRRPESVLDAVFTSDKRGRLVQVSQSGNAATFDPPLIGLGELRLGASWCTRSSMIFPSKFRASTPTEVSGRVVGLEKVTVPAGTFRAFRVDAVTNGRASTGWHVPGVGMVREVSWEEELVLTRLVEPEHRGTSQA